ncbi:MAG: exonuclease domain-containing protein [Lawsonibacter sp.]|nr:exonuclease domain-containing protein [Lawsonibacter sp.]
MGLFSFFKKKAKPVPPITEAEAIPMPTLPIKPVRRGTTASIQIEVDASNISLIQSKYIAFDVETTGLDASRDRIIEIGAILFVDGKPVKTFSSLVNPDMNIPASATSINHITNAMVASAPSEQELYPEFVEFLGSAIGGDVIMCAHNARFDFNFLCNTLSRLGYDANFRYVDTLNLSRKHIKGLPNYKQSSLEHFFGLVNDDAHRAASDAENCGKILYQVLNRVVFTPEPIHQFETDDKNFKKGYSYWSRGEEARLNGEIEEALKLFDKARNIGYKYPAIYESYAKAFRKLKDYENEIAILEEAIKFNGDHAADRFGDRIARAKELLLAQQEKEKEIQRKELDKAKKAEERQRREELKKSSPKQQTSRPVIQYSDDGTIIKEYESVASASKEIGISSKCIRDAASGKQKHAGGFCWRYSTCEAAQEEVLS